MADMKFCVDCVHCNWRHKCMINFSTDLVTGVRSVSTCQDERGVDGDCGYDGRRYVAIDAASKADHCRLLELGQVAIYEVARYRGSNLELEHDALKAKYPNFLI